MADPESLRRIAHSPAPFSTWLGIVLLFALFGLIVLAVVGPSPRGSDYEEMRAKKRVENLNKLREETQKELTTYTWVDKNKGVARIPINRAIELTVGELARKKPAPAGPIATPPAQVSPPAAAAAGPAAASPAPAGSPKPATASPQGAAISSPPPSSVTSPSPAAGSAGSPPPASPAPAKSP